MIDHVGLAVSNFAKSKQFYTAALRPLDFELVLEAEGRAGFGIEGKPEFWIHQGDPSTHKVHVALRAYNRTKVDAFYRAALQAGGVDNGAPGIRKDYHSNYYGAFVLDPDGHNIEAVCHRPE